MQNLIPRSTITHPTTPSHPHPPSKKYETKRQRNKKKTIKHRTDVMTEEKKTRRDI
jgi:hypothetical protein